jgi:hypothetical protein
VTANADDASPKLRRSALERLAASYPLLVAYLGLLTLYAWQTTKHPTPWLFTDELQWAELSRGVAEHGTTELRLQHVPFSSLYSYFIAPAWWLGATARGYAAAKYLNAAAMTASLFPAYGLARLFVPRRAAFVCGVAAASIPALAYTGLLIPEPLAYAWSTLVLWLVASALLRATGPRIVAAVVALAIAPAVRAELAVLIPAAGIATAIVLASSLRARRVFRAWMLRERVGAITLLVLATISVDAWLNHHSNSWRVGTYFHHRMFSYGLWAMGAFAIGVGVLPVFASLAWLLNSRLRLLDERVLFGTTTGAIVAFGLYTAVKASYISTQFAIRVEERNLIYLSPVIFVVTARWALEGRTRLVSGALAAAAVGYLLDTTPYHNTEHLYSDAFGLAILQWLNRTWAFTTDDARRLLFGILIGAVVAAAVRELVLERGNGHDRWRKLGLVAAAGLAALTVTWNLTGEIVAADASNSFAKAERSVLPTPPDWIDRVTGRARTLYMGDSFDSDPITFWSVEFWNRSIEDVWADDGTAPLPGQVITPNFTNLDGEVAPQIPVDWGVAPPGIDFGGRLVEVVSTLKLYHLAHPIRLVDEQVGVAEDTWMGTSAWYVRFGRKGASPGVATVTLSRRAACGDVPPALITIRVSKLALDKTNQPIAATVEQIRRVTIHSTPCDRRTISIPATPPFRIDLTANRTFQPGPSDPRQLSVMVGFGFKPNG